MVGAIQKIRIDKSDVDLLFLKKTIDEAILSLYTLKTSGVLRFFLSKTIIFTAVKRLCRLKTLYFKALKRLCGF